MTTPPPFSSPPPAPSGDDPAAPRCRRPPPELAEGIRLFNEGRWFEAHEVLEDAWRAEPTELRRLYQGLLQVGVGLLHARRGNLRGALAVLDRGLANLEPFAPQRMGVDVGRLLREAATARTRLAAPGGLETFDWSEAPRVHPAPPAGR